MGETARSPESGSRSSGESSGQPRSIRLPRTIFETPVVATLVRLLSRALLRVLGWRIRGGAPSERRYVLIAAPHTSNWDFLYLTAMASVLRVPIRWLGKHTLFPFPFASLMRWMGGIPVDRRTRGATVDRVAGLFAGVRDLIVVVPPEGSRSRVRRWRTGFYYIAESAQVPIALGFLDYSKKVGGIGPLFDPTGDFEQDLVKIQSFYEGMKGRNERQFRDVEGKHS